MPGAREQGSTLLLGAGLGGFVSLLLTSPISSTMRGTAFWAQFALIALAATVALAAGVVMGRARQTPPPAEAPSVEVDGWPIDLDIVKPQEAKETKEEVAAVDDQPEEEPASATLVFSVNGKEQRLANPSPSLLLSDYLRHDLGLTGTKVGCGEGGCGACTVVAVDSSGVPKAINACLRLLCACDGLAITTSEGFGGSVAGFSAVQRAIAEGQGSQCGFCTPGWVAAMSALLARADKSGEKLTAAAIEAALDGNLCRCSGYRPILQAFKAAFASDCCEEDEEEAEVDRFYFWLF